MSFVRIQGVRTDRLREVYCNGTQHVRITHPLHEHSGVHLVLEAEPCECHAPLQTGPAAHDAEFVEQPWYSRD
jgi:hypothetical protein